MMDRLSLLRRVSAWKPEPSAATILLAGLGSAIAIYVLAQVQYRTSMALLLPAFGASCTLVFAFPQSPFARPVNVIGGHLVASACGLLALAVFGSGPEALAIGVGLAVAMMLATRTMHPPAGGDPLAVILGAAPISFLIEPILLGTVAIVLIGAGFHRISGGSYPLWRQSSRG